MYDFTEIHAEIAGKCKYYGDDCSVKRIKKTRISVNPLSHFSIEEYL